MTQSSQVVKASQFLIVRVTEPQKQLIRAAAGGNMSAFVLQKLKPALDKAQKRQEGNSG